MARDNQLTVFATGNGDSILIEADGKKILTDINYLANPQDDLPDIGEALWDACTDGRLDLFVLTHPDRDHLRGFDEVFHTGKPDDHNPQSTILVEEIWCSPYGADPNYETDDAKPLIKEIKRRKALIGTAEGGKAGNRLVIRHTSGGATEGKVGDRIKWQLLAPTIEEADIPEGDNEDSRPSSNSSSLVIRWSISVGGRDNLVLLGGDSTATVWERIWDDNGQDYPGRLTWEVLVSAHHTSRYALGSKDEEGEFHYSDDAIEALSQKKGKGWVVSSSKKIERNDDDPPSWSAKQKYLKILADRGEVTDGVKERFLCTGEHNGSKPGNIVFYFTAKGPSEKRSGSRSAAAASVTSVAGGGNYGQR